MGSLEPCVGGGIAGMVVGSQWRSWAARVCRAAVMMWWACPSRTMWRYVPKSFQRWAAGWSVMWARARWWAFPPPSGACVRLSPGMCWCWRGILLRGGGWYFTGSVWQDVYARVSRSGAQVHVARDGGGRQRLAQGRGAWGGAGRVMVLTPGWSMPYRLMCTAKGPTARWSLWGWMLWRRATARVWERPSLIHTVSARDAAGFRQSVVMPVIVRFWLASDTLAGAALMRGMVWSSGRVRALRLASCRCSASWAGVCIPVCLGFLLGRSAVWKGVGQEGGWWREGLWEVPPWCPCAQGGRGGPFCLYGVSLVVSATGDEDVGCRQLIHLCGVGEVAGDSDLGGVVLAGGGVGDDVVGRPFVLGGVFRRVQLEWGVERLWCWGLFLGLRVGRHFGFDQVLWAPGFRGPYLCGCRCCSLEEGGCVGV